MDASSIAAAEMMAAASKMMEQALVLSKSKFYACIIFFLCLFNLTKH